MAKYIGTANLDELDDKYLSIEYAELTADVEDWLDDDSPWDDDEGDEG